MTVGDAAREPHGDPQTHLDTDPVNRPDAAEGAAEGAAEDVTAGSSEGVPTKDPDGRDDA